MKALRPRAWNLNLCHKNFTTWKSASKKQQAALFGVSVSNPCEVQIAQIQICNIALWVKAILNQFWQPLRVVTRMPAVWFLAAFSWLQLASSGEGTPACSAREALTPPPSFRPSVLGSCDQESLPLCCSKDRWRISLIKIRIFKVSKVPFP